MTSLTKYFLTGTQEQLANEILTLENKIHEMEELILDAAPLVWVHANSACEDYCDLIENAHNWEKRAYKILGLDKKKG